MKHSESEQICEKLQLTPNYVIYFLCFQAISVGRYNATNICDLHLDTYSF